MIKKTLILTAIIALTTTTAFAETKTSVKNSKMPQKPNFEQQYRQMPPRDMHRKGPHMNFEQRLNLTDKQKAQVKKNREADRVKMEPIMKQLREKEQAKHEIFQKYEQTDPELIKLNNEIKKLRDEKHKIMEANRKAFESILTKEQKAELEKMKAEHNARIKNGEGANKFPKHPENRIMK